MKVQCLQTKAIGGTFSITVGGLTGHNLPFDADEKTINAEVERLLSLSLDQMRRVNNWHQQRLFILKAIAAFFGLLLVLMLLAILSIE